MTTEELLSVLHDFNDVYLSADDGKGSKCVIEIEPQMSVILFKDGSGYKTELSGCEVKLCGGKKEKTKKLKLEKLIKFLEKYGAVSGDAVNLIGIGSEKISYEQYLAARDFKKIDMAGLLDKYFENGTANRFSLTCPYSPDGEIYNLSEELAEIAKKEITDWCKAAAKEQVKDLNGLPPFDRLYAEIEEEYRLYYKENEAFADEHGGNVFMCDKFANGETKYKEPQELWHVYSNAEFAGMCARQLERMKLSPKKCELLKELEAEEGGEALKQNLVDVKISFTWHCTTSGELSKTFFFTLNEQTEKWLLKHKNDYDFNVLQDLAFYNDDEILFSSCTHEEFHTDLSKKGEDK